MNYAELADVRRLPLSEDAASDEKVAIGIEIASRVIENFCGRDFATEDELTFIVNDVRNAIVVLPTPFKDITSVTINDAAVDATSYYVEDWGLRLYRSSAKDVDGFPVPHQGRGLRVSYGAQVAVTATFGYADVPSPVTMACALLAAHFSQSMSVTPVDPRVKSRSVEGYSTTWVDPPKGDDTFAISTGDPRADMLLSPYVMPMVG